MEALSGILNDLKINNTIWIQLGCFIVSYLALSNFIFKPYHAAYRKRKENTVGGEEFAERVIQETEALTGEYESKARQINANFSEVYNEKKVDAMKEYDRIVGQARGEAQSLQDKVRQQIGVEVQGARTELNKEIPKVSLEMASKLIGKEITQ